MSKDRVYTLRRLFALSLPYKLTLALAMFALACGSGINLLLPELLRRLVDGGYSGLLFTNTWLVALALVGLFALQGLSFYFRSYLFGVTGQRVMADLRRTLHEAIILQEMSFFDRERASDLVSRLSSDAVLVQDAVSIRLSVLIRYGFQVVLGIILMLFMSLRLTLAIVCVLPLIVFLSMFLGKRLRALSKQQQAELGRASAVAEEGFSGARIVKAFNQEEQESARYSHAIDRVLELGLARTRVSAFFSSFVSFLMNGAIVIVLLIGVQLVGQNVLTAGELTAFMLYGVIVAVSFAFFSSAYAETLQSMGAAERIFEIIDSKPAPRERADWIDLPNRPAGHASLERISFSYPSRAGENVLNEVTISVDPGKTTALVGPSGAGKSTVVALLLKFYEPTGGRITFDGIDMARIDPIDLRRHIAIVPQDPQLFGVSIGENLRYGKPSASREELTEACRKANILSFVESLPQGFDTPVGERGVQLSGGQRQRLAIARALLKDPALLILDEATSALDSENEFLIREAIASLMEGRTCLVIAHRLSTVKNAHKVIVMDEGSVVQEGTHQELSLADGLYRRIVERQDVHTVFVGGEASTLR